MPLNLATSNIVTLAFLAMEKTPPASFEDSSEEAALTTRLYPDALAASLEGGDWSFASVWVNLPAAVPDVTFVTDPAMPHFYKLPGDCLRVHEVGDGCDHWRIDKAGLRADRAAPLPVRYTARVDQESRLPRAFQQVVALQLAIWLAPRFLGTSSKIEVLKRDHQDALDKAQREDSRTASESRYDGLPDQGDWATGATR